MNWYKKIVKNVATEIKERSALKLKLNLKTNEDSFLTLNISSSG